MKEETRDFYEAVYELVKLVPPGRVTTYGAIAKALGSGSSSRLVGYAMNACFNRRDVPAHRVVNRNGLLTGRHHFPEELPMQAQLEAEGVVVTDHQVQKFDELFWDPGSQLGL